MKSVIFKNVSYSYGDNAFALKNLSFELEGGSYIALVGHNGSGKSTIAKLLIGLLPLKEGEILINGLKLEKANYTSIRKQIGIVFQNPDNQFIGSTVEEDIAFGLENRQIPHEDMSNIITQYAEKVDMLDYLKKEPVKLSGGQKQRVAIAGVLALSPKIVIFDEATSMLDPKGRREIFKLIKDMRKNMPDLTIISITHDVEEAYLADQIILLKNGEVKAIDKPDNIFNNQKLIEECNLIKPFILDVKDTFKSQGINLDNTNNEEEVIKALCKLK